ncbi:MAG: zinc-ribbon domain containing protein [Lachnospiraceae bacterium]|nr:zinc-ribbon domain containing protein [Lachnospiraceae bacterium]
MGENSKKLTLDELDRFLSYKSIFIWDESSLNAAGFTECIKTIFPAIQKHPEQFIVPSFVKDKMEEVNNGPALMLISKKCFYEYPDVSDFSGLMIALKAKGKSKVNVFVNDSRTRSLISGAAKANDITAYFYMITDSGEIESFRWSPADKEKPQGNGVSREYKGETGRYSIKSEPERIPVNVIKTRQKLDIGSSVYASDGSALVLSRNETVNNNGITFSTDKPGIWVKIFNDISLNTYTESKICRMIEKPLKTDGLCWPKGIVKDSDGIFRGYILDAFEGYPLHLCIFKRAGIETYFPNWTKPDLCELTITILKKIEFMHKNNVLFGCINPAAIRVVDKNKVFFVETDNYQIDGFPSMIHNLSFTAPELLDRKIYLATKANENFAVAELVFMLLMPGKTPYSVGQDETPEALIRKMQFPYSNGQIHGDKALPGMWRFMWSHLLSLKGCFYNVFQNGAKYNKPEDRRDVFYWESALSHYIEDLKNTEDPESLKIYPNTFRRGKGEEFYKCNYCGVEHPRFYFNNKYFDNFRICNSCINKKSNVSFTCQECKRTFYYTNEAALFHKTKKMEDPNWHDQKYCADCKKKTKPCVECGKEMPYFYLSLSGRCPDCNKEYKNTVYKMIRCIDCGRDFSFTVNDHEYYTKKGLSEPRRCPECRKNRNSGNNTNNSGSNNGSKKGGLFNWFFS